MSATEIIKATTDLMILTSHEKHLYILLSKRKKDPFIGQYALPGRFVRSKSSAEEEAKALLEEMIPGQKAYMEQLYTFTDPSRDPRGRVISIAYLTVIPWLDLSVETLETRSCMKLFRTSAESGILEGNDETVDMKDLAFDHQDIIRTGLQRLAGKIEYTDIGFEFLNDKSSFIIKELKDIFEAALGRPLDPGNFRRTLKTRYIEPGKIKELPVPKTVTGRGRPSAKYQLTDTKGEHHV